MRSWHIALAAVVAVAVVAAAAAVYLVGDDDTPGGGTSSPTDIMYPDGDYAYADDDSLAWSYWLGSMYSPGYSDAVTPIEPGDLVEIWKVADEIDASSANWLVPGSTVCVGDSTYYYRGSNGTLNRVITATGEVVASVECVSGAVYNMAIAYGDGKIFVPTRSGTTTVVIAYDADTLEQLFVTTPVEGGEVQGPIIYYKGRVFLGTYSGDFACFSAEDLDPTRPNEVSAPLWTIEGEGWYNMSPAFFDDMCVVVEKGYDLGGSVAYLVRIGDGTIVDTLSFTYEYCTAGAVAYDGRVYIALSALNDLSQAGDSSAAKTLHIHSFVVTTAGFDTSSERVWVSDETNGGTQSIPVIWNDRIYICGGGATLGTEQPFTVIDIGEDGVMTTRCTLDIESKGTVSFTTAYATEENGWAIYIYLLEYGEVYQGEAYDSMYGSADIYVIRDSDLQDSAEIVFQFEPSEPQFGYQSFTISPDGYVLIRNDSTLFCYGFAEKREYTAGNLEDAIDLAIYMSGRGTVTVGQIDDILARYQAMDEGERASVSNWEEFQSMMNTVTVEVGSVTFTLEVFTGCVISLPWYPVPEGHTVAGWTCDGDGWTVYSDRVYGDMTITAILEATCTVSFDSAGGTSIPSIDVVPGSVLPFVNDPVRDGYAFDGWYLGGVRYVPQETVITGDVTLTAGWLKTSVISFDSAGGSSVDPIDVVEDVALGALPTPTRVGYEFAGWYHDGMLFEEGTVYPYDHDITLTASWLENETITVSNGNGVLVTGAFSSDTTVSTAIASRLSSSARSIQSAVAEDTGGTADCVLMTINGSGLDVGSTVTIDARVGSSLDGTTITVYVYQSGQVERVRAVVVDGMVSFDAYGTQSSGGMQIVFGIETGTELPDSL